MNGIRPDIQNVGPNFRVVHHTRHAELGYAGLKGLGEGKQAGHGEGGGGGGGALRGGGRMAGKEPPLRSFGVMTPWAAGRRVRHTGTSKALAEYKGRPTVIHLYTG